MPEPETPPPVVDGLLLKQTIEDLFKAGLSPSLVKAATDKVLAGEVRPDFAVAFGQTLRGSLPSAADPAAVAEAATKTLADAAHNFRPAPPIAEAPPPPPAPHSYGAFGLGGVQPHQPPPPTGPLVPGSVEHLAQRMADARQGGGVALAEQSRARSATFARHAELAHSPRIEQAARQHHPELISHTVPFATPPTQAFGFAGFAGPGQTCTNPSRGKI